MPTCSYSTLAVLLSLCVVLPTASVALRAEDGTEGSSGGVVLEAIAQRGVAVREAALIASQYPDLLVRIDRIQLRSAMGFEMRMDRLEPAQQDQLWELVAVPGLLEEIVEGGVKDQTSLAAIADRADPPVRAAIEVLGGQHFELLQEVLAIREAAEVAFAEELAGRPVAVADSFEILLQDPPLLSLLARRPSEVVELGRAVAFDPNPVRAQLEELALGERVGATDESAAASVEEEAAVEISATTRVVIREDVYLSPRFVGYPYWFGMPRPFVYVDPWFAWTPSIWFYSDSSRGRHAHRGDRHHRHYQRRHGHGGRRVHRTRAATRDRHAVERVERRNRRRGPRDAGRSRVRPAGPRSGVTVRTTGGEGRRAERMERRNRRRSATGRGSRTVRGTERRNNVERAPDRPGPVARAGPAPRQAERGERASGAVASRGGARRKARRAARQRGADERLVRRADRKASRSYERPPRRKGRRAERGGRGEGRRSRGGRR